MSTTTFNLPYPVWRVGEFLLEGLARELRRQRSLVGIPHQGYWRRFSFKEIHVVGDLVDAVDDQMAVEYWSPGGQYTKVQLGLRNGHYGVEIVILSAEFRWEDWVQVGPSGSPCVAGIDLAARIDVQQARTLGVAAHLRGHAMQESDPSWYEGKLEEMGEELSATLEGVAVTLSGRYAPSFRNG